MIPYGVTITEKLDKIEIHRTPQYLASYIDDALIAGTSTEFIRAFLETSEETEEDADQEWNTLDPPSPSKLYYKIRAIWTYIPANRSSQHD